MPSGKTHYRITLGDAIGAHERALRTGGRAGIVSLDSIESAIGRPYTGYYRPIEKKAAALVESVVCNHGFVDGNKRTALYLVDLLINRSGFRLKAASRHSINEELVEMLQAVADRRLNLRQVEDWFKIRIT